ncbi:VacJ family lipoprotein [Chitiniphilus purpureus]|uniref:VacJ family lipoprotein n=1 Tax=Chitiniphilus purpureus TaxID=2981137 RepID=A0ABY6DLL7_9NEIS|nr:VacJ family lipoprotein [Chitiniphilus sp. CD1]UXY15241.1 VacJ family lipoprotein [Chitiniphilus sp. CD1]
MKRSSLALVLTVLLAGCATPQNYYDPLEPVNRKTYAFNKAIDRAVLKPTTEAYVRHAPQPVQTGVRNFFGNLDDLFSTLAALLQFKGTDAVHSGSRVLVNTTAGLAGLIDWGTPLGMKKGEEDFGQVLGFYGVPSGAYLILPFYGPLTVRDSAEPVARALIAPLDFIDSTAWDVGYYTFYVLDRRAQLLPVDKLLEVQPDEYAYVRDAYLQRRWNRIHDGHPPHPLPMGSEGEEDYFDPGPTPQDASTPAATPASEPAAVVASGAVMP